jgi:aryl-alcohol dehydrogenase-like predicted oxidoreductase
MTVIDTSEGYGGGRSEELIGRVTAGQRDRVFLAVRYPRWRAGHRIQREQAPRPRRAGAELRQRGFVNEHRMPSKYHEPALKLLLGRGGRTSHVSTSGS